MSSRLADPDSTGLIAHAELRRQAVDRTLSQQRRAEMGQFMTPAPVARFMASLFRHTSGGIRLLDPGAGVGSLTVAFMDHVLRPSSLPQSVHVHAYELEETMLESLSAAQEQCRQVSARHGVSFQGELSIEDFILAGVEILAQEQGLFSAPIQRYTHCIMNPPYRKIQSNSIWRAQLQRIGIETSNLYTGFLAVAVKLLNPGGELVAIVPRSFCNGVYFRPFREFFLREMSLKHLHVFGSRESVFRDNEVLQENIILYAVKGAACDHVEITSSFDPSLEDLTYRQAAYHEVIDPNDRDKVISIAIDALGQMVVDRLRAFDHSLEDLGLSVSTGPVVDFRLRQDLRREAEPGAVPLIYPSHFSSHRVVWPKPGGRKPNAIAESKQSEPWLMPNGWYVLTRRFSSKEERRRIVAAIFDPTHIAASKVGFENHLNVFHQRGNGLDPALAMGLAVFLNSTLVDLYFRQFSGHTQVNVADLKTLHFPDREALIRLGQSVTYGFPTQREIDALIRAEIQAMSPEYRTSDPVQMQQRVQEALSILTELGLPKAQRNERSALTLLALLDVKPSDAWADAKSPRMGITPIMNFIRDQYGKTYAPNTRETIRRATMHQFVQAGIAVSNPDEPDRPVNSPRWVYQVTPAVLDLVREYGQGAWQESLTRYLKEHKTLAAQYAHDREMSLVPLVIRGEVASLSAGAHSQLIKAIVEEFGPRFAPGAEVLYIGDTGSKMMHFDGAACEALNLKFDPHGKFPDVVLYYREMNWLFLIEAVTSHGPVDAKRHAELDDLFAKSTAGLIYVTAFLDRQTMGRFVSEISWETEVWIAEAPSHLVHFDGESFLGPY